MFRGPGALRGLARTNRHQGTTLPSQAGVLLVPGEAVPRQGLAAQAAATAEALSRSFIGRTVADVERDLILQTLDHCLGNRTHASNILGISIRTLRNKLNQYSDEGHRIPPPAGSEARAVGF